MSKISKSDIKKAELAVGRKLKNEWGTCFDSVPKELMDIGFLYPKSREELCIVESPVYTSIVVCHGIGVANMPGQEGTPNAHAWIEFVKNGELWAYDVLWGIAVGAEKYRKDLKLSYVIEYTMEEFIAKWLETDNPGPWDAKIKKISDRGEA
tara:strand:+ start:1104 stop:1559 length:456 start_codon:yes stop_codon:yes gene_type:complete